jgi:protein-disulfide isomerase
MEKELRATHCPSQTAVGFSSMWNLRTLVLGSLALLLTGAATGQGPAPEAQKSALDKTTLEQYVRHLFVWGPTIEVSIGDPQPTDVPGLLSVQVRATAGAAIQEEAFLVSKDGRHVLRGTVYDIDRNPFHREIAKLDTQGAPALGTSGAPVVLVVFSDFQCGFCREEGKVLRENLIAAYPNQVRLYFKDFPLSQVHPWAKPAAVAGRCVYRQDRDAFWDYHDWVFAQQAEFTAGNLPAKVLDFAAGKNLDALQLNRCMAERETEAEVDRSIALARSLNVNSTPTIFLNGRKLAGQIAWPQLQQLIDHEIGYQSVAKNAGDDCGCEVKLPSPVSQ